MLIIPQIRLVEAVADVRREVHGARMIGVGFHSLRSDVDSDFFQRGCGSEFEDAEGSEGGADLKANATELESLVGIDSIQIRLVSTREVESATVLDAVVDVEFLRRRVVVGPYLDAEGCPFEVSVDDFAFELGELDALVGRADVGERFHFLEEELLVVRLALLGRHLGEAGLGEDWHRRVIFFHGG